MLRRYGLPNHTVNIALLLGGDGGLGSAVISLILPLKLECFFFGSGNVRHRGPWMKNVIRSFFLNFCGRAATRSALSLAEKRASDKCFKAQIPGVPTVRIMSLHSFCCLMEICLYGTFWRINSSIDITLLWYALAGRRLIRRLTVACCLRKVRVACSVSNEKMSPVGSNTFLRLKPLRNAHGSLR